MGLAIGSIAGCSSVHSDIRETARLFFAEGEDTTLSPEEIAAFPYTAIYVRKDDQPRTLIVLGFVDTYVQSGSVGDHSVLQLHWISSDSITLVTEYGRIVRTQGLTSGDAEAFVGRNDLHATSNRGDDPLRCIITQPSQCPTEWRRELEYIQGNHAHSVRLTSTFDVTPNISVELPTRTTTTSHIVEHVAVLDAKGTPIHTFTNEFWAESNGHVVKSKQTIFPSETKFEITQIKWGSGDE
nr:YjbF family lipoprotein [Aliidiomarina indica]